MDLATADLLLRSAVFALAAAGAVAIVVRAPGNAIARDAAVIVGGLGAFAVASAPGVYRALGPAAFPFEIWCLATPAFVWLLAMRLFRDGPPPGASRHAAPLALVLVTMPGDYGRFELGLLAGHPRLSEGLLLAGRFAAACFVLAACGLAIAHWRSDLVEERRRIRAAFVATLGVAFLAMASSEVVFGARGAPLPALVAAHSALLAVAFAAVVFVAAGGMGKLLLEQGSRASPAPLALVAEDAPEAALARRIVEAMEARALWKRERLGIGDLAREMGAQEYRVRRAINRHLGHRNFHEFMHGYRLEAAAARLADPAQARLPVLSIALDCGYGSIGPFNRAFKARYGVTPTQYRNMRMGGGAIAEGAARRR